MNIIDFIKKGLLQGIIDYFNFSGSLNSLKIPESLFQVEIAKAIYDGLNQNLGNSWKIILEEETKKFASRVQPYAITKDSEDDLFKNIFSKVIFRIENMNTTRNGKVDIAVYNTNDGPDQAKYVVEVKNISPSKKEVQKDLKRMTECFEIQGKTGNSTLEYAYLPFIVEFSDIENAPDKVESEKNRQIKKYSNYIEKSSYVNWELQVYLFEDFIGGEDIDWRDSSYGYFLFCYIGKKINC